MYVWRGEICSTGSVPDYQEQRELRQHGSYAQPSKVRRVLAPAAPPELPAPQEGTELSPIRSEGELRLTLLASGACPAAACHLPHNSPAPARSRTDWRFPDESSCRALCCQLTVLSIIYRSASPSGRRTRIRWREASRGRIFSSGGFSDLRQWGHSQIRGPCAILGTATQPVWKASLQSSHWIMGAAGAF